MDGPGLERLVESIRREGLMQPVIVRPARPGAPGAAPYELVAGERRWRAAQRAGLTRIPAVIRALDDEHAAQWALVENLQREDLNAMDRAHALRALCERFGLPHAEAADRVGLDRSTVANLIRLTDLEPEIGALVRAGRLTAGHGKALLGAPAGPGRIELARRAAQDAWTVRRLEHAAAAAARVPGAQRPAAEPMLSARAAARADVERRLGEHLATRVEIRTGRSGARGRIVIRFYDLDHFDALMAKLGLADPGTA
jgi:ParB family chromosome partitioning protein